jgi:hypothetical protein
MAYGTTMGKPPNFDGFWPLGLVEPSIRATGVIWPPPMAKTHQYFFPAMGWLSHLSFFFSFFFKKKI